MTRRPLAVKALALFAATAAASVAVIPALAASSVDAPTTISVVTPANATLKCSAETEEHLVQFSGTLDMSAVIAKWNELKEKGRSHPYARFLPAVTGKNFDETFADLSVTVAADHDFQMQFTLVDKDSFVDPNNDPALKALLEDKEAWKAAYEAGNENHSFTQHMIVDPDPDKKPSYDSATGTFTVPMTLKAGLKAGELDEDYKTLTSLKIVSPAGLLKVTHGTMLGHLKENKTELQANAAKVIGGIARPTSGNALVNTGIAAFWGSEFPIVFNQIDSNTAVITLDMDYAAIPNAIVTLPATNGQPSEPAPEAVQKEAQKILQALFTKTAPVVEFNDSRTITNPEALPVLAAEIKIEGGKLLFKNWRETVGNTTVWREAPELVAISDACAGVSVYANFVFVPNVVIPPVTSEPSDAEAQPQTPVTPEAPAKPMLPNTGSTVATVGTIASLLLLAGAGLVTVRRRES